MDAFRALDLRRLADWNDPSSLSNRLRSRRFELFTSLAGEADSDVDIPDAASPVLDFELAARVDFAPEDKQELLASTSPAARAERLAELLELAVEAIRTDRQLRERAGQNGKVTSLDE